MLHPWALHLQIRYKPHECVIANYYLYISIKPFKYVCINQQVP